MAKPKGSGAKAKPPQINHGSAKTWDSSKFPMYPSHISVDSARQMLTSGFTENAPNGDKVSFSQKVIYHWEVEKGYDKKQVDSRLSRLNLARQAVRQPREIWDQGNQIVYIQAYRKKTGGKQGVLVFVEKNSKEAKTYFPKDVSALDKSRKGKRIK